MTLEEITAHKTGLICELMSAEARGDATVGQVLAIVDLEGQIADLLIAQGETLRATVNLVSQGSLLDCIGRHEEAKVAYEKAMPYAETGILRDYIQECIAKNWEAK